MHEDTHVIAPLQIFIMDKNLILKPEHLSSLKRLLQPSRAQCKHIYAALGYDPSDLHVEFFRVVILKITTHGKTTKQQLIAALRSQSVGHGELAEILEKEDSIDGKYYYDTPILYG